jgi:hypothetical protein
MGEDEGRESEWNEASFKAKRLDEIQERLNYFKNNIVGITDTKHNYIWYLRSIEALYGEGVSKYSSKEIEECEALKKLANNILRFTSPHIPTRKSSLAGVKEGYNFNQKNYDMLMDILWKFEMKVKDLNDKHGLTTGNKEDDLF